MLRGSGVSEKIPTREKQNKNWKSIAFYSQYHKRRYDDNLSWRTKKKTT